jgi:hypothetical protein
VARFLAAVLRFLTAFLAARRFLAVFFAPLRVERC